MNSLKQLHTEFSYLTKKKSFSQVKTFKKNKKYENFPFYCTSGDRTKYSNIFKSNEVQFIENSKLQTADA